MSPYQASSDRSGIRLYDVSQRKQDNTKGGYRHGNSWYRVSGERLPGEESDDDDCRKGPNNPDQLTKSHYTGPGSETNKHFLTTFADPPWGTGETPHTDKLVDRMPEKRPYQARLEVQLSTMVVPGSTRSVGVTWITRAHVPLPGAV